jgi:hypothetical protein
MGDSWGAVAFFLALYEPLGYLKPRATLGAMFLFSPLFFFPFCILFLIVDQNSRVDFVADLFILNDFF